MNRAINQLRQRRVQWVGVEEAENVGELDNSGLNDADITLEVTQVRRAIETLPDGFRTVLSLYLIEGYDHEEIAGILGISESTSRSQYLRAKKRLAESLKRIEF